MFTNVIYLLVPFTEPKHGPFFPETDRPTWTDLGTIESDQNSMTRHGAYMGNMWEYMVKYGEYLGHI